MSDLGGGERDKPIRLHNCIYISACKLRFVVPYCVINLVKHTSDLDQISFQFITDMSNRHRHSVGRVID